MKKYFTSKAKLAASLLMAGVLTMGTVGATFADGPAQGSSAKHGYFGNVTAKEEASFTVKTRESGEIQLAVDQDTHFRVPGSSEASVEDPAVGSRVTILAEEQVGTLTASG